MSNILGNTDRPTYVSLVPQHTQTFKEKKRCIIEVPPDISFFDGRNGTSYISCDILNTSQDDSRWTFPTLTGSSSLIDRVDIYSLTGTHLSTMENYNELQSFEIPYLNSTFDREQTLELLGAPLENYTSDLLNVGFTDAPPDDVNNNMISPLDVNNLPKYTARRIIIPLRFGLFKWYGKETLFPNMFFRGIRIEISFAKNSLVCKRLGAITNTDTVLTYDTRSVPDKRVYLDDYKKTSKTANFKDTFADATDLGLVPGNVVYVTNNTGAGHFTDKMTIDSITDTDITFVDDPKHDEVVPNSVWLYVDNTTATYTVENVELKVLKYTLDPRLRDEMLKEVSKNGFEYEFVSYDMFSDNVSSSVLRYNSDINSVASKALAIFTKPSISEIQDGASLKSYYSGILPNDISGIQYFINGRLFPVQSYNPQNKEDRVIVYNELQKAWKSLSKRVKRFGSYTGMNPEDYSNPFVFSRQLADEDFFVNLVNAEPQLRLTFSGNRPGNMMLRHFVFSKKTIVINDVSGMIVLN